MAAPGTLEASARPRVWLVLGDKPGDNAQAEVVGEALTNQLGWKVERRRVAMLPQWVKGKPRVAASLHHIDPSRSDLLEPPWPDIVVTVGRRPSMVGLWLKEQAGGRLRLVRLGKPTGNAERFDLVVVSSEVQVVPHPNVLRIGLPLMRIDAAGVADAAIAWGELFTGLPRPVVGILVGGPTGPYRFGRTVIERIFELAAKVRNEGGTPWVSTSRRTPPAVTESLERGLPGGSRLFRWAAAAADNPYKALLALADGLVVTGDSISMMVEVARLGRPLQVLPLVTTPRGRLDLARRRLAGALFARAHRPGWRNATRLALGAGLSPQTRDIEAFHAMLLQQHLASPLGGSFLPPTGTATDDLDRVLDRIATLARP